MNKLLLVIIGKILSGSSEEYEVIDEVKDKKIVNEKMIDTFNNPKF